MSRQYPERISNKLLWAPPQSLEALVVHVVHVQANPIQLAGGIVYEVDPIPLEPVSARRAQQLRVW